MAGVSFLLCLCVSLMKQAMLKLMGGLYWILLVQLHRAWSANPANSLLNKNGLLWLSKLSHL